MSAQKLNHFTRVLLAIFAILATQISYGQDVSIYGGDSNGKKCNIKNKTQELTCCKQMVFVIDDSGVLDEDPIWVWWWEWWARKFSWLVVFYNL